MPKSTQQLQTIRTEGALLPPDILQRIASLKVDGVRPADYHLPDGFRINDAITQSWDILKKHWKNFQEAREQLSESEHGTSITNERWLLPLFKELEYGRLSTSPSPQIEDRSYPIERFYNHTPIHLIGCNLPMDRRTKGARGAATSSPHSMMQEFLNRSDQHQWGFLSNGRQLRILRDNVSLSRQAYVEFDLEGMMEGEVYGDFVLLWLLCHQSRVEAERVDDCWLEKWSKLAREEGTRVLNNLRTGVTRAIELLGQGFISHPHNDELRSKLQESGTLTKEDLYRQLLRIVYRLLFLFVAEDRRLLHPPDAEEAACELYDQYYSTRRLREMAFKLRGSKHSDLWHSLSLIFHGLHRDNGLPELGLPALGSFLWDPQKTSDLLGPAQIVSAIPSAPDKGESAKVRGPSDLQTPVFISNDDLLAAIRALAYVAQDKVLRDVDYRNLDTEEFGSVYESLLELQPVMHVEAKTFSLNTASGNERKTSGSYYTEDSLVQCLLDSALDPVIAERLKGLKGKEAEDAILNIKVCDPACGSGHFLIGAARRLARHLARIRTGESEPSPEDYQRALRDVISHCIYGVDINPMSVELCKVALWMEAMEPGKPLSFLDHHIQCGNSLLGTTPALLAKGIPETAFTPIEGDVKARVTELKKRNKKERDDYKKGQGYLFEPFFKLGNIAADFARLNTAPDGTLAEVGALQEQYTRLVKSSDYESTQLLADAWCAAFVWKKDNSADGKMCPTERDFRKVESHAGPGLLPHVRKEVERLRDQYQFFHWHLAFPDVFRLPGKDETPENEQTGWSGGFDVVLGNPPWERVKLQEKEWFAERNPDIATAPNADARKRLIDALRAAEPVLHAQFLDAARSAEGESHLLRNTKRYPLCGRGDINVYAVFAEGMRNIVGPVGRSGCVLPSGIATDDTTKFFFQDVVETKSLVSLFDFENREAIFPGVHRSYKFCLFTTGSPFRPTAHNATFVFFALQVADLDSSDRRVSLSAEDIALLNPNTRTCPIFRSRRDAELTMAIYRRVPVLIKERPPENPWGIRFSTMFHMSNDSHLFRTREQLESEGGTLTGNVFRQGGLKFLPLYEAKLVHHFDHRWATYDRSETRDLTLNEKQNSECVASSRYWVVAREVWLRIAELPDGLLEALRTNQSELIVLSMTHLLFARWLLSREPRSTQSVVQDLFAAWCAFVERFPFARALAPVRLGLCGNNPASFKPLDQSYLPAAPLEEIETGPRQSTAWYEADAEAVALYLNVIGSYRIDIPADAMIEDEDDILAFAELCLEQASPSWLLGFRDICRNTDERTVICSLFPRAGVGNNLPLLMVANRFRTVMPCLSACLSSLVADFAARFKVGGTHLNFFITEQLAILPPSTYSDPCPWAGPQQSAITHQQFVLPRVLELSYTAWDLEPFARDCGYTGPPFRWDEERRLLLRAELDAAFFHLYGLNRDDTAYILDTFPIVRRKDIARTEIKNQSGEVTQPGTYITKDTILAIYDAMQTAIATGTPYQTRLTPPPGPPTDSEGNFVPNTEWDTNNWPPHIHPTREEANA